MSVLSDLKTSIKEQIDNGDGAWRLCSGCSEHKGDYSQGEYSNLFDCEQGSGCSECGGLGVVWDSTDYNQMAEEYITEEREIDRLKKELADAKTHIAELETPDWFYNADDPEESGKFATDMASQYGMAFEDDIMTVHGTRHVITSYVTRVATEIDEEDGEVSDWEYREFSDLHEAQHAMLNSMATLKKKAGNNG